MGPSQCKNVKKLRGATKMNDVVKALRSIDAAQLARVVELQREIVDRMKERQAYYHGKTDTKGPQGTPRKHVRRSRTVLPNT